MSEIFNLEKLYRAYLDCRKHKRKTIDALKFEWDVERNLFKLLRGLERRSYRIGRSICFVVDKPVLREIFAGSFRDRVVQHLLVNEVKNLGEKVFIFDSFACRKKKGTHLGVRRIRRAVRMPDKNLANTFYGQIDISGFFMSIDHNILYSLFKKLIEKNNKSFQWKEEILWLAKKIIFHKPTQNYIFKGDPKMLEAIPKRKSLFHSGNKRGLPIGNYSSQFFANLYLNELDQFAKKILKCKFYFRYVDDVIILDESKEKLILIKDKIDVFLRKSLSLQLNNKKTKIKHVKEGIDFLGYFVRPKYTLVRRRVANNLKNKIYQTCLDDNDELAREKLLATINSYFGHFSHANSFNLRKKTCLFCEDNFGFNHNSRFSKMSKPKDLKTSDRSNL